jgi:integration host factor subunit beta
MTRSELIKSLFSKHSQLSEKQIEAAVKCIFDQMSSVLAKGTRIELRGFGCFSLRFHPPRMARNPKTGEKFTKEGRYSLHFKPGKELRERVNQGLHQTAV